MDEERFDGARVARALRDLEDDVARTGAPCSDEDVARTAARHGLSVVELAGLREQATDASLIEEERPAGPAVIDPGARPPHSSSRWEPTSPIATLLGQLRAYPLLSHREERSLSRLIEDGARAEEVLRGNPEHPRRDQLEKTAERGLRAKQKMVASNVRLAVANAKDFRGQGLDFEDLVQAAIPGLIRAAEKFDWRKGFKFSTYATWWIRQSISRALADTGRTIRLPVHIVERLNKFRRANFRLSQRLGRDPTVDELAEALDWDPGEVTALIESVPTVVSLDSPLSGEATGRVLSDLIASDEPLPEDEVDERLLKEYLHHLLENLSYRERFVLEQRYGLGGTPPRTLEAIGRELGVTRERVRQVESEALQKLQSLVALEAEHDDDTR